MQQQQYMNIYMHVYAGKLTQNCNEIANALFLFYFDSFYFAVSHYLFASLLFIFTSFPNLFALRFEAAF